MSGDDWDGGEYADGARYDAEYGGIDDDGRFFLDVALSRGPRVLDLGCGTGRLAIPLAVAGKEVVGIDAAPAMLARARSKPGAEHVTWVHGDIRDLRLARRFDSALAAGHTFQMLLTDAARTAFLQGVARHLHRDGVLAFDCRPPPPVYAIPDGVERRWHGFTGDDGNPVEVFGSERWDTDAGLVHYRTRRLHADGRLLEHTAFSLRPAGCEELRTLLAAHGWRVRALHGGYRGEAPGDDASHLVVLASPLAAALAREEPG